MKRDSTNRLAVEHQAVAAYLDAMLQAQLDPVAIDNGASGAREHPSERPVWASQPFTAAMLDANGLKLAISKQLIGELLGWTEPTRPLAARSPWLLGSVEHGGVKLQVVDAFRLLVSDGHPACGGGRSAPRYQHILPLGDGRWGFACESGIDLVDLDPAQICWRSAATRRRWLAGTIAAHRCALLDVPALLALLDSGEWAS